MEKSYQFEKSSAKTQIGEPFDSFLIQFFIESNDLSGEIVIVSVKRNTNRIVLNPASPLYARYLTFLEKAAPIKTGSA